MPNVLLFVILPFFQFMITIPDINISDFDYALPEARIALFPAAKRDASKLLVSRNDTIIDKEFYQLAGLIPENALLVLNNTRVIHARLLFHKPTGAAIEIFCLEPQSPERDIQLAMQQKGSCVWKCLVGNAKKWKEGTLVLPVHINSGECLLSASIVGHDDETFSVQFNWNPEEYCFAQIIEAAGKVPLPPYIHRPADTIDNERYQTVFARNDGSVAAPTAGLHFTNDIFQQLNKKNISTANITLHVGAGTFKPVSADNIEQHVMHAEQVVVSKKLIESVLEAEGAIIAVGTTSVRSLESLYWLGLNYMQNGVMPDLVKQWEPYNTVETKETKTVLKALLAFMSANELEHISFSTQIIIMPGYQFRIISGMVTNFHQPKSTLLLLISAFLGDRWKAIYEHALQNDYRFLSYGDACLFL